jgi:hypothetical protein
VGTPAGRLVLSGSYATVGETEKPAPERPVDSDLDGMPDKQDRCPRAAGPRRRGGCPQPRDLDGDGVVEDDACPDTPGARFDDPRSNGCPDKDNDHLADPIDRCPLEPGSDSGCPRFARLLNDDFVVTPPVSFVPARPELIAEGRAALLEIIQTMRANPELPPVRIAIGIKGAPPPLTELRKKHILALLQEETFPQSRYELVTRDDLGSGAVAVNLAR